MLQPFSVYVWNNFVPRLIVLTFHPHCGWLSSDLPVWVQIHHTTHGQLFINRITLFVWEDYRWEMLFPAAWTIPPVIHWSFEHLHWCCLSITASWNLSFYVYCSDITYCLENWLLGKTTDSFFCFVKSKMLKRVFLCLFLAIYCFVLLKELLL